ncbi:Dinitrogenase iron-molybdenum cofactor biosynthesis protein [Desulfofarcimen acetoxidans DSM 771]|jgi:predicted Fe-Mo cluster-binding NifX family protein|uniref:Dinitrogenase iron-molybdenum cofactor biosynthesis protein n=1 Tax=Desulfofarcimen acetoxidans (strain ATCC 49208 / DSM 771 / KCTC 5769 / VKM B-1644 / 5575) TaxID=485916 RepID=C8W5D7_DESAS|nr:NifB/NifX family molybdenum-iron cluster-binding protein [Desulfofarcimen acetoxidans]ACV62119.1 Dinitrogenase iron-molybdenum cofactor biosynthesis protein [Desulfofarcimen acetoxidans DSM 771]
MKIAVSAEGQELNSPVNPRFGRCEYFVIYDQQTGSIEAIANPGTSGAGGAGIKTAQALANKKIDVVLVGNVGPNAVETLNAAKIDIYSGITGTVQESIDLYKKGALTKTNQPSVDSHFGLK